MSPQAVVIGALFLLNLITLVVLIEQTKQLKYVRYEMHRRGKLLAVWQSRFGGES